MSGSDYMYNSSTGTWQDGNGSYVSPDVIANITGNDSSAMDILHEEQAFNSAEAQKQRDWQTNMSNTSYQRAMADLKAAGLNPYAIFAGGIGASYGSGASASASGSSAASVFNTKTNASTADKDRGVNIAKAVITGLGTAAAILAAFL